MASNSGLSTLGVILSLSLVCWPLAASAQESGSIGYATVADALQSLRADPTAVESNYDGWTVFAREGGMEIWSFTPGNHPAHPSAAKRTAYRADNGDWHVATRLLCGATKTACDALMAEYLLLDEQMKERISRDRGMVGN
jgi:hypothetical protein